MPKAERLRLAIGELRQSLDVSGYPDDAVVREAARRLALYKAGPTQPSGMLGPVRVIEQRDDFDVHDADAVVLGSQADALAECERRADLVDARSR